jgi:hypothetical protein
VHLHERPPQRKSGSRPRSGLPHRRLRLLQLLSPSLRLHPSKWFRRPRRRRSLSRFRSRQSRCEFWQFGAACLSQTGENVHPPSRRRGSRWWFC